jgi:hypothetical protein
MIKKRFRNAGQPGQWRGLGRRQIWEAPVQHGGHVVDGAQVASGGGCLHVEERMLVGFRCQRDEVRSQGWPGWLAGEFGDELVGSTVEHLNDLGSDELLCRHVQAVGVALDGVEQPCSWVVELSQQGGG